MRRNSVLDYVSRFLVTLFMAIPSFLIGITIVTVGVLFFTWRPPITIVYLWEDPVQNLQMTVIPALVLGVALGAILARMSRATILEVFREDYVRTGRAKGLNENVVVWRHVLKNALLPVITVSGLHLGSLLGGSVAVEVALGVPGLGKSLVQGMEERDWMLIQNLVLLYAVVFVFVNLLIDSGVCVDRPAHTLLAGRRVSHILQWGGYEGDRWRSRGGGFSSSIASCK